jgi:hypothetical protein
MRLCINNDKIFLRATGALKFCWVVVTREFHMETPFKNMFRLSRLEFLRICHRRLHDVKIAMVSISCSRMVFFDPRYLCDHFAAISMHRKN